MEAYRNLLLELYPESRDDVDKVIKVIGKFDVYMQVLFGSDSPFFKDAKRNLPYYFTTFPLWFIRFLATGGAAIMRMRMPMEQFLSGLLENKALIDIVSQHFFKKTPAFFAMSYFSLYPDYFYPKGGGVGSIPKALTERLLALGSEVRKETEVTHVDAFGKTLTDGKGGNKYSYDKLIWCADLKHLYRMVCFEGFTEEEKSGIAREQEKVLSSHGGRSQYLHSSLQWTYLLRTLQEFQRDISSIPPRQSKALGGNSTTLSLLPYWKDGRIWTEKPSIPGSLHSVA